MHRRHAKKNIPIELLRALVTVVEARSFTKAGDVLDLTQSAVSTQIKRLGDLLGGKIFVDRRGDLTLTDRGRMVLQYARRMLTVNDELLTLAAPSSGQRRLVVGLPVWLGYPQLLPILERCSMCSSGENVHFRCDRAERHVADLNSGATDIAYICDSSEAPGRTLAQWSEKLLWVKSPNLALPPGVSIPLVSWPGTHSDRLAVELLRENGLKFHVAFSAPDLSARLAAVTAGLGVLTIHARMMFDRLEIIHGLPALPVSKTGIFARNGLDTRRLGPFLDTLKEVLAPRPQDLYEETAALVRPPETVRPHLKPLRRAG